MQGIHYFSWIGLGWLLHLVMFAAVTLHCLRRRRHPSSTLLWIFVAWSFPFLGPFLYLTVGIDRVQDRGFLKQTKDREFFSHRDKHERFLPVTYWKQVEEAAWRKEGNRFITDVNRAMNAIAPEHPMLEGNRITPLVDGDEAYPEMLAAIKSARDHIHLQSFIFARDAAGRMFMDALAKKAQEGVTVRILYDRFGSSMSHFLRFFRPYTKIPSMHIAGWTQANPLKRQFQLNLRNHRKALIVDGKKAFCGGINISSENLSTDERQAIRDYHYLIEGAAVHELQYTFFKDWFFMTGENAENLFVERHFPPPNSDGNARIRLANSGPASKQPMFSDLLFLAAAKACDQLIAVTPYFVPTMDILHAFRAAALRGVDVRILLPEKNNHFYAGWASRAMYADLLDAGVRIYHRPPPFMHAKALLVDDQFALIGTGNIDVRSLHLNYETNLAVFDDVFINRMKGIILTDISQSRKLQANEWARRPFHHQVLENLCYLLTPVL